MRFFLSIFMLTFTYISSVKADVYYCNATSTILVVLHEIEGRPIYTQNMAPYPETLKFKRESDRIILKDKYEKTMLIHRKVFPRKGVRDYFMASGDGAFGATGGYGMTGYFEYFDGLATYHMGNTISTYECDKF